MTEHLLEEDKPHFADMMAILADLEQSHDCAEIYLSGEYNSKMRVRRALYESAFISFRRALGTGTSRYKGSGSTWIPNSIHSLLEKEIKNHVDKVIAHRACKAARRVEFDDHESEFVTTKYSERIDLLEKLKTLAEKHRDAVMEEMRNILR